MHDNNFDEYGMQKRRILIRSKG